MNGELQSLLDEGYRARREGRLADARRAYELAVEKSREAGEPAPLAKSLERLGGIERDLGDSAAALDLYGQSVAILRSVDEGALIHQALAHAVRHVGDLARELNDLALAERSYEEALSLYRANPKTGTLDLANTLRGFALLQTALGKRAEAIQMWREAGELYNRVWQEPGSPFEQADLMPGVNESARQIALLSEA